jgi:2-polyprenyl-3-methyl-5-hydroxy-6-metoxy-1,4-benzoquinol methylase
MARRHLLEAAIGGETRDDAALGFHAALARQCFINEYVFFHGEEEIGKASTLRDHLVRQLAAGATISPITLLAVAAYFPLHSVPGVGRLLDEAWPAPVAAVLTQQLREPEEEAQLRKVIPRLTGVADTISRRVQDQYEENPYPRWVRIPLSERPITIGGYLRQKFPFAAFRRERGEEICEILSVGCGTGQLALEMAQSIEARLLAIDLSRKSLGYAARKARELGLKQIEFAQADLMELGNIGRKFDVVECSGVLHHLRDPFDGWRTLLPLLRPGGFMTVGLYSKLARRGLGQARTFIAEKTYGVCADEIRRCRQDLLDFDKSIASSSDFFGISSCRDLLFHVQEQEMQLPAIAAFIQDNGLTFLGFETDDAILQRYRRRFPDDRSATHLGHWHRFEQENPDAFARMYRFWVQK